ncbi:MAG: Hsp20/alpha crystallin family protein [Parachlamydiales bacterium]|jgi:HSP20 family protein
MKHHRALIPSILNEMDEFRDFFDLDINSRYDNSGISLYENQDKVFVEASLPGVNPKEIQINFEKGVLWIKADVKREEKDVKYHLKSQESFSYRVLVPSRVDENSTPNAVYKDGILKITFEKSKFSKAHKIEVKTEK